MVDDNDLDKLKRRTKELEALCQSKESKHPFFGRCKNQFTMQNVMLGGGETLNLPIDNKNNFYVETQRHTFIMCMSICEWCVKEEVIRRNIHNFQSYLGMSKTVEKFYELNLINKRVRDSWKILILFRNWVVHNGGYPDRDCQRKLEGKVVLDVKKNERLEKPLCFFTEFSFEAINCFESWFDGYQRIAHHD